MVILTHRVVTITFSARTCVNYDYSFIIVLHLMENFFYILNFSGGSIQHSVCVYKQKRRPFSSLSQMCTTGSEQKQKGNVHCPATGKRKGYTFSVG